MIEVNKITKMYGPNTAVSDLSFTIEKGKIYGFLGPNGAGKTTTMNIMTGCLAATSGNVKINGFDIYENPVEAKKHIGYLPEHPPLYLDMTPYEYLCFVGGAKKIKSNMLKEQIANVMEQTHITSMQNRLMRNLSKGYRQRVGLAQAILGDPQVIILDEPTVGLDPVQIIEIRELLKELSEDKTIILSSHILTEVSAICDEILVISHGKLVAQDTPENLSKMFSKAATTTVITRGNMEDIRKSIDPVTKSYDINAELLELDEFVSLTLPTELIEIREKLSFELITHGFPIVEMSVHRPSLEEVFITLTSDSTPDSEPCLNYQEDVSIADDNQQQTGTSQTNEEDVSIADDNQQQTETEEIDNGSDL